MERSAFLFPGQGAQHVGMAKAACDAVPAARALLDRASAVSGLDLAKACFEGPEDFLNRSDVCQPAILAASLAVLEALKSRKDPAALGVVVAAGLSLGEYTALTFAGALSPDDAVRLVCNRGRYMQEACEAAPSGMASVLGLAREKIEEACAAARSQILAAASAEASGEGGCIRENAAIVGIANLNAPGQIVISGAKDALEAAAAKCKELGAKRVIPLKVAGAYHSALMAPAEQKLRADLAAVPMRAPALPVISNVTADAVRDPETARRNLAVQVVSPVRWEESVRRMAADGIRTFYEIGPGTVLAGLVRKIAPEAGVVSLQGPSDIEAAFPA